MKNLKVLGLVTLALAGLPAAAQAEMAYAAKEIHLRAGPAVDYPIVITLPAGVVLDVQGCLSDYRWCDVISGPDRGWVYAANIVYPYRGQNVPVLSYGAVLGIGIIAFSLGAYWDSYYVDRPWYPQRPLWLRRPPPPRLVPDVRRPPPAPGYRPPGEPRPPQPGTHPPLDRHPVPPGARPPDAPRPAAPMTQPPRPQYRQPAERPQSRPQPVKPGSEDGHRPQREPGGGVR